MENVERKERKRHLQTFTMTHQIEIGLNTLLERNEQCRNNECKVVTMIFKYNSVLLIMKARIYE